MSCDPNFFNVALLLHFDGGNGNTSTGDSSPNNYPMTFGGAVPNQTISTTQKKFGTSSLQLVPPCSSMDQWVNTPIVPGGPLDILSGGASPPDFTIEFWFWGGGATVDVLLVDFGNSNDFASVSGLQIQGLTNYAITGFSVAPTIPGWTQLVHQTNTIAGNTWHHGAVVRASGTTHIYLDGVQDNNAPCTTWNSYTQPAGGFLWIGSSPTVGGSGVGTTSYIDEFRVSNFARYTANFTPDIAAGGGQCDPTGGYAYGKFVSSPAFKAIEVANFGNIQPRIYMPGEATTIGSRG